MEGVADAVDKQAEAGRDTSFSDRLKMAGRVTDNNRCIYTSYISGDQLKATLLSLSVEYNLL